MPATLRTVDLRAARGERELFAGLGLTVVDGDVWGLVGPNGAGKSTLLSILAAADADGTAPRADGEGPAPTADDATTGHPAPEGHDAAGRAGHPAASPGSATAAHGAQVGSTPGGPAAEPEIEGQVLLTPPTASAGLLTQEPDRRPGETLSQMIARRTGVAAAELEMNDAAAALAESGAGRAQEDRYAVALDRWLGLGGADLGERTDEIVTRLGLGAGLDAETTSLSGGEAARASLAVLLLQRYDILLLDEPTND
ncbi:MAG: ATP-binding cassette domain-containing protein, partial [Actinomycetaceae bacterium]